MLSALQLISNFGTQRFVFNPTHLVDRITQLPGDMKFVKGNLLFSTGRGSPASRR